MTAQISTAAHAFQETDLTARIEQASHLGPVQIPLPAAPQGNMMVKGSLPGAEQPMVFKHVNTMDGRRTPSTALFEASPTSPCMPTAHADNPCDTPRPNKAPLISSENGSHSVKKVFSSQDASELTGQCILGHAIHTLAMRKPCNRISCPCPPAPHV
jgi:hypothetical protein